VPGRPGRWFPQGEWVHGEVCGRACARASEDASHTKARSVVPDRVRACLSLFMQAPWPHLWQQRAYERPQGAAEGGGGVDQHKAVHQRRHLCNNTATNNATQQQQAGAQAMQGVWQSGLSCSERQQLQTATACTANSRQQQQCTLHVNAPTPTPTHPHTHTDQWCLWVWKLARTRGNCQGQQATKRLAQHVHRTGG
jgi:hypothetical protein